MNENQNLLTEIETLERELDSAPEWREFGQILTSAHEVVYQKPSGRISVEPRVKFRKWPKLSAFLSVAVLLLFVLGIGLFYGNRPSENISTEYNPELDWEEGELELELFDEQLERVVVDDSSLEFEYAILEDSLSEWDGESDENELF